MKMRKRKQNLGPSDEAEIIDSDDQDQIIQRLSEEMEQQQRSINHSFRILCIASATLSLLALAFLEVRESFISTGRLFRWIHVIITVVLHLATAFVVSPSFSSNNLKWILYLPWGLTLLSGSSCLFHARTINKEEDTTITITFHRGLLLGNALTTAAALWLRNDSASIQTSVEELRQARYNHKSL